MSNKNDLERLIRTHLTSLSEEGKKWRKKELQDEIVRLIKIFKEIYKPNSEERIEIIKAIESTIQVKHDFGTALVADDDNHNNDWVKESVYDHWPYWERYKTHLIYEGELPVASLQAVDTDTNQVLNFFGDPESKYPFSRRGMLIGDVQSGKTTNFNTLICKAADIGYKLIIILAGGLNMLRNQTQERLDEAFIGYHIVKTQKEKCGVGHIDASLEPISGTSKFRDFTMKSADNAISMMPKMQKDSPPIVMVMKKKYYDYK